MGRGARRDGAVGEAEPRVGGRPVLLSDHICVVYGGRVRRYSGPPGSGECGKRKEEGALYICSCHSLLSKGVAYSLLVDLDYDIKHIFDTILIVS